MKNISGFLLLFLAIKVFPLSGQIDTLAVPENKETPGVAGFNLFASEDLLEVTIRLDLTSYMTRKLDESNEDAVLTIHLSETDSISNNIKVKYRGNFRFENCAFSPMEVSFKKHIHAYSDNDRIKKIKLVTHCQAGNTGDNYVLREYLVYKLYNVVSDTSFRVRLLRITYIDTQNKKKTIRQYGFFIEPDEILEDRINADQLKKAEYKTDNLTQRFIKPEIMDKVSVFNYMIANWDWNIPYRHNVVILKSSYNLGPESGIAVPYDFDLCGIVNPDYVVLPTEEYGLKTARDRIFLGQCRSREVFKNDLLFFADRKMEFYDTINNFPYLEQKAKKDIISFLDTFFYRFDNNRTIEYLIDNFIGSCKQL